MPLLLPEFFFDHALPGGVERNKPGTDGHQGRIDNPAGAVRHRFPVTLSEFFHRRIGFGNQHDFLSAPPVAKLTGKAPVQATD